MTPEERAFEIIHSLTRHGADRNLPHTPAFSWKIEAAIRAAENDALERAAALFDTRAADDMDFGAGYYIEAAEIVRALKHKESHTLKHGATK